MYQSFAYCLQSFVYCLLFHVIPIFNKQYDKSKNRSFYSPRLTNIFASLTFIRPVRLSFFFNAALTKSNHFIRYFRRLDQDYSLYSLFVLYKCPTHLNMLRSISLHTHSILIHFSFDLVLFYHRYFI